MTCFLCLCGTAIHYSSVNDKQVGCTGCLKQYIVDEDGKLHVQEQHDYVIEAKEIMEANE